MCAVSINNAASYKSLTGDFVQRFSKLVDLTNVCFCRTFSFFNAES